MTWSQYRLRRYLSIRPDHLPDSQMSTNRRCYIRKDHDCGKIFGASKSCFIACPTDDELEPLLELMSEKLSKHGIEPIIAVKDRAYGQDIFCTKICGKIIESRFCAVILDDSIREGGNVPNPNVYYEYGLMTSLGKQIIPLQKQNQKLAFNIQSYDTIKYTSKNMAAELERAIRDAIQFTDADEIKKRITDLADKSVLRKLELAGFNHHIDSEWYLYDVIEDTLFKGFTGKDCVLYAAKVDSADDAKAYLDDLDIIIYRTEKKIIELQDEESYYRKKVAEEKGKKELLDKRGIGITHYDYDQATSKLRNVTRKLHCSKSIYIAFIGNSDVLTDNYMRHINDVFSQNPRYHVCFSNEHILSIGEVKINFSNNASTLDD